ncbi:MAG: C39 family peptidase [Patescibacteria group bacterium]|jgi:hypothetical protein
MKKFFIASLVIFALGITAFSFRGPIRDTLDSLGEEAVPEAVTYDAIQEQQPLDTLPNTQEGDVLGEEAAETAPVTIPATMNLDVPFTSQAPSANWDEVHEDTCEEASLLMIHRFYENKPFANAQDADAELLALVDFENERFGDYKSTNAEDTATMIREYYGYTNVAVVYDITMNDVKREVAQGRPVLLLAAGRELGNPNFTGSGPLYHALVVKGWTETEIITNDPGTRKGHEYRYDPDVLMNAVHDWNNGDPANGRRVMIVMHPNP